MSDIPTKGEIDALERSIQKQWHDPTLQKFANAARELHRIRESPGLTAEQRADLEAVVRHDALLSKVAAAALATIDTQAAALAERDAEIARLKTFHEIEDAFGGRVSYQLDRIKEHLDESGKLKGDGKWRIDEVLKCIKAMLAAEDLANKRLTESQARGGG